MLVEYIYNDQDYVYEMMTTCRTNGGHEDCRQSIGGKTGTGVPLARPKIGGWIILKWI
jgi:hypothetical protein